MASALGTLCGQSYGAKQYHMLGVYLQRSWIVMFVASIFLLPLFIFTTPILKLLGQSDSIAYIGGELIYVMCGGCRDTWKGFSLLAFKDLWPVVKLSLSSGVMLCLELWYYTALVLITGYLKNSEVSIDALTICLNINGWEMMISLGFMAAASVRVGNELGRGSSTAAKFSIVVSVFTSFIIGFVLFLFFLFLKGRLAYIFTENEEVVEAIADLSSLLAVSILLNSVQPVLSGVAVGAGWQSIVAYINVACYYIIGIPIGLVLGFVFDMGVKGVWMGMLFGTFVQTIALVIITYKTNWDEQVIIARNRVKQWVVDDAQEPKLTTSDVS
ncbi:hypothetical protein RGQ29_024824 [Quercus rubra]|uniref:Uncharacterized protein n=1 Tax=Quercus rubra TaxID=3512 RepID=A0AAN7EW23_QUERU|nr:hypothetical protein RGQ29_024824 [Quercus rubra]